MPDLIIVVDSDYAERLETSAKAAPVWIVATQANRRACERLWKANPHPDHRERGAITCYETSDPEDRLESLLGIIPDLEIHHGEVQGNELVFPNGFVLEVIGLALTDNVVTALRQLGFTSFVERPEGFQARK
jgi:hypothetical protein